MNEFGYIIDKNANLVTIRDPMVVVVGDTYYVTGTQMPYWRGANDGVHLWSSKDLETFTHHGIILARTDMPEDMWCRDRFWAPEIFDGEDGWFYLTVSCQNESEKYPHGFGILLAKAKEITGPYEIITKEEPVCIGIDGTIFKEDGKFYLGHTGGDRELFLDEFDPQTGKIIETHRVCGRGEDGTWDSIGIEGQCIVKRNGIYYQWYSSWTDDNYRAGILTSKSITGPWTKYEGNPVLLPGKDWFKGGHNHSFKGLDGKDYLVFHGYTPGSDCQVDVERMYIRQVVYKPDGTVEIIND